MNTIDNDKVIIFSYPRAGTKLIAKILADNNYHNYSEWYDTWTSTVDVATQTSRRLSRVEIENNYSELDASSRNYVHTKKILERHALLDSKFTRSTITVWWENLSMFPMLMNLHKDRTWILPKRNSWDQLLSWYIVFVNKNPNGDIDSNPVQVSYHDFERLYWKLRNVTTIQDWIYNNYRAVTIDFDELITGQSKEFGFEYSVDTDDQHDDLESMILNLKQTRKWFEELNQQQL